MLGYSNYLLKISMVLLNKSLIKSISAEDFHWKVPRPHKGGLLIEKISKMLHKKPLSAKECLMRMREEEERKEC